MYRFCKFFIFAFMLILVIGCHFFEDSDNVDECPLNSGYPCACSPLDEEITASKGFCRDFSTCIYFPNSDNTRGVCSPVCAGSTDTVTCSNTNGYGSEGLCLMPSADNSEIFFCAVFCTKSDMASCPPGQKCVLLDDGQNGVCYPKLPNE